MTPARFAASALRRLTRARDPRALREELVAIACDRAEEALRSDSRLALAWSDVATAIAGPSSPETAWRCRRLRAKSLHAAGRLEDALQELGRLAVGRLPARRRADVESTRAVLLGRMGRREPARRAAARARSLFHALRDPIGAAHVDVNEANVLHRVDEHARALALYRRALPALRRARRLADVAACQVGLANAASFLGRHEQAERAYRDAEAVLAAAGHEHARLVAAYNRHYLALLQGRAKDALAGLAQVRAGFERIGDARATAQCDADRAEVLTCLRCWPEARDAAAAAAAACDALGLRQEAARTRVLQARAESALGAPAAALRTLGRAAHDFARERNAFGLLTVRTWEAQVRAQSGELREAAALASHAAARLHAAGQGSRAAAARIVQARASLASGQRADAERAAAQACARAAGDWSRVEGETLRALLALDDGRTRAARAWASKAADRLERLAGEAGSDEARLALGSEHADAFRIGAAAWLAPPRPRPAKAFAMAERARRFGLLDGSAARPAARVAGWARASKRPATRPGARSVPAVLPASARGSRATGRDFRLASLDRVAASLAPHDVLLEYVTHPDGVTTTVLVVTTRGARVVPLGRREWRASASRLGSAAERLALARAAAPASVEAAELSLRGALAQASASWLEPLRACIASARRVLVVPPAQAQALPWALLPLEGEPAYARHETCVLPAASWLLARRARGEGSVALGCADDAAPLIEREVRAVARAAGGRAVVRRDATWPALAEAARTAARLHVAGHGWFRADAPGLSALHLADGWVTADDLESLRLRGAVVTLSACHAGVSRSSGEQSLGLVRALLRAGARSVVATPWSVPDDEAARFFPRVHALLAQGLGIAAAVRAAQREAESVAAGSFLVHGAP